MTSAHVTGALGLRMYSAHDGLGTIEYPDLPHRPNRTSLGYEPCDARLWRLGQSRRVHGQLSLALAGPVPPDRQCDLAQDSGEAKGLAPLDVQHA
jgi:hypothetical protein